MVRAMNYGVWIGGSVIVVVVAFIFTRNYRAPVFIINQITLLLLIVQSSMFLAYLCGPYREIGSLLTGSFANVSAENTNTSVAASIFQSLFVVSAEFSLVFQATVMFRNKPPLDKIMPWLMGVIAVVPIVSSVAYATCASLDALKDTNIVADHLWVGSLPRLSFAITVSIFSFFSFLKLFMSVGGAKWWGCGSSLQCIFFLCLPAKPCSSHALCLSWTTKWVPTTRR